jgi:hypothetical protein
MAKKQWALLAVFILLAAVYICAFTNWGRRPAMQISHTSTSNPKGVIGPRVKAGSINTAVMSSNLDHPYRLTEVKVVCLAGWQTNKSILPFWHLISVSNSVPTKKFYYGVAIRGMKPSVANIWPKPLETNVTYRLFLTAGSAKGQHDFTPPPK